MVLTVQHGPAAVHGEQMQKPADVLEEPPCERGDNFHRQEEEQEQRMCHTNGGIASGKVIVDLHIMPALGTSFMQGAQMSVVCP